MKMTYKDLKSADNVFKQLLKTPQDAKLAYRMGKLLKKFVPALEKIDEEGNTLVRKHGKLENGRYSVPQENMDEFTKDFVEFLGGELEAAFEKIPFDVIEKAGIKISPDDMLALEPFVTEPKEIINEGINL